MSTDETHEEMKKSSLKGMESLSAGNEMDELKASKIHPDTHYRKQGIHEQIEEKFKLIYGEYKKELTGNEKKDLELFSRKDQEWKQFCYKIVQRQKLVTPNGHAFRNKVRKDQEKQAEELDQKKWENVEVHINGKKIDGIIPIVGDTIEIPTENFEI